MGVAQSIFLCEWSLTISLGLAGHTYTIHYTYQVQHALYFYTVLHGLMHYFIIPCNICLIVWLQTSQSNKSVLTTQRMCRNTHSLPLHACLNC